MAISIFAKRAYLNTQPSKEFESVDRKPANGYLKRVSSIIRADQIAEVLGARLNPSSDYQNDICIYVKPNPDSNGEYKFEGKAAYLDIIDEISYTKILEKHPKVGIIVLSERDFINVSTLGLKNKIYLIPQQHCNFNHELRTRKKITTAGIIGNSKAFTFIPADLKPGLTERGIKLLEFSKFFRREDIIDFYKKIDIQIVWRPYKKTLANSLKIVNAASFGIPTIALDESHFKDLGNCYIGVNRLDQLFSELDLLIKYPARYEAFSNLCLKKAEEFHIEKIADLYRSLPG